MRPLTKNSGNVAVGHHRFGNPGSVPFATTYQRFTVVRYGCVR